MGVLKLVMEGWECTLTEDARLSDKSMSRPMAVLKIEIVRDPRNKKPNKEYYTVQVWGHLGKTCAKLLKKGHKLMIRGGRLKQSRYGDENGRRSNEVIIEVDDYYGHKIVFMDDIPLEVVE